MLVDVEHHQRNLVVHAEARCRRIHDGKPPVQDLDIGKLVEFLGVGILVRIGIIYAVYGFCKKYRIRLYLYGKLLLYLVLDDQTNVLFLLLVQYSYQEKKYHLN